jgi:cell division septation protein DedD
MPSKSQLDESEDTEITLTTGRMMALFLGLVALCAVFFSFGYSLGKSSAKPAPDVPQAASAPIIKPLPKPAVAEAAEPKPPQSKPDGAANDPNPGSGATDPSSPIHAEAADPVAPPISNGYYVQVAAVTKQEDADALIEALRKKSYPAFSAPATSDKLFHVQVGPFADIKEAEITRGKLVGDGYNPILKK